MKIIILAGGSGTRLWPISRSTFPKQFLQFGDEFSLLQKTIQRFIPTYDVKDILIVTNKEYYHLVKSQVVKIDPLLEKQIIQEPARKNTAPAILLAVKYLQEKLGVKNSECFLVSSSDHFISPVQTFLEATLLAKDVAHFGNIVTFGIRPHKPETGYGYIRTAPSEDFRVYKVEEFVEKPDYKKAKEYLLSGNYLWNSGIFAFQVGHFLDELKIHAPEMMALYSHSYEEFIENFEKLPNISIDYALLEKSQNAVVLPLNISWSDVGSWDSVYDAMDKDKNQNVKIGNILDIDTKNSLIIGGKRLISTIGLDDMLIIETDDAIFLAKKGESQRVKALVEELKIQGKKETHEHLTSHRPWGTYTVLEEGERYKIKRIVVNPLQRLSLQMHYHRSEHWVVVKGTAKVTIGEEEKLVHENESIFVPKSTLHRLENPGKVGLELIEVQVGEYVGEDDIVRYEDIYGRVEKEQKEEMLSL